MDTCLRLTVSRIHHQIFPFVAKLHRLLPLALALSLFGLDFGAKLCVIGRAGSDIPNWDPRGGQRGTDLFLPYFQGRLILIIAASAALLLRLFHGIYALREPPKT
jgi:hypothetical protein